MSAIATAARTLKVDITSDIICPFCIIGYRQLLTSIASYNTSHPSRPIEPKILFHPYKLMPDLPDQDQLKEDVLLRRFGKEKLAQAGPAMRKRLEAVGVEVDYKDQPALISSTHLPHRLLTYAALHSPSTQASLSEDLMLAHHSRGTSPSHLPTLASLAVKHSVFPTEEAALAFLKGNEMDKETEKGYEVARGMGVSGVPFFVFEGKWGVSGAIGEEGFTEVFDQILGDDKEAATQPKEGVTC